MITDLNLTSEDNKEADEITQYLKTYASGQKFYEETFLSKLKSLSPIVQKYLRNLEEFDIAAKSSQEYSSVLLTYENKNKNWTKNTLFTKLSKLVSLYEDKEEYPPFIYVVEENYQKEGTHFHVLLVFTRCQALSSLARKSELIRQLVKRYTLGSKESSDLKIPHIKIIKGRQWTQALTYLLKEDTDPCFDHRDVMYMRNLINDLLNTYYRSKYTKGESLKEKELREELERKYDRLSCNLEQKVVSYIAENKKQGYEILYEPYQRAKKGNILTSDRANVILKPDNKNSLDNIDQLNFASFRQALEEYSILLIRNEDVNLKSWVKTILTTEELIKKKSHIRFITPWRVETSSDVLTLINPSMVSSHDLVAIVISNLVCNAKNYGLIDWIVNPENLLLDSYDWDEIKKIKFLIFTQNEFLIRKFQESLPEKKGVILDDKLNIKMDVINNTINNNVNINITNYNSFSLKEQLKEELKKELMEELRKEIIEELMQNMKELPLINSINSIPQVMNEDETVSLLKNKL